MKGEDDEAINYFMDILPRIRIQFPELSKYIIEFTQYPHETVYIPGGWWHAVINLDDTIAITQVIICLLDFIMHGLVLLHIYLHLHIEFLQ